MIEFKQIDKLQTRHMGNKILSADKNHISGYKIVDYNGVTPRLLEHVATIENDGEMTWDNAYDKLFNEPIVKPEFGKNLLA